MSGCTESDQIFKAAKAKGLDVKYYLYTDEGHGFARPSNRCVGVRHKLLCADHVMSYFRAWLSRKQNPTDHISMTIMCAAWTPADLAAQRMADTADG